MICQNATTNGLAENAPPEIKRNILKSIIDRIVLNVDEGWFELEGVIRGRYPLFQDPTTRRKPRRKRTDQ
jgi:hypothetical protein